MRPDRGVVKKAIIDAKGSITKAAVLLGCSRPTIYQWIYQLGLERVAGIRIDNRSEVYNRDRKDTSANSSNKTESRVLTHGTASGPMLRAVTTMAPPEIPVQATMRLPEALWKRVKIACINEDRNVSDFVRDALEAALAEREAAVAGKRKKGSSE